MDRGETFGLTPWHVMERYDGMPHRILDLPAEAIDWDEIRRATRETP